MERRFRHAPFPLYGLPPSLEGGRFLGGGSWGTVRGRETIHSLSLVHGVLVEGEGEGPMLVMESAWPGRPSGGDTLRVLAESLWSGRARDVLQARDGLRHRRADADDLDPLPARVETTVSLDGESVPLDVLAQPHRWVGRARLDRCDLTIEGLEWRVEGLTLVEVRDLEPYVLGSRRFEGGGG